MAPLRKGAVRTRGSLTIKQRDRAMSTISNTPPNPQHIPNTLTTVPAKSTYRTFLTAQPRKVNSIWNGNVIVHYRSRSLVTTQVSTDAAGNREYASALGTSASSSADAGRFTFSRTSGDARGQQCSGNSSFTSSSADASKRLPPGKGILRLELGPAAQQDNYPVTRQADVVRLVLNAGGTDPRSHQTQPTLSHRMPRTLTIFSSHPQACGGSQ